MSAHKKSGSGVPPLSPQVGRVAPNAPWPVVRVKDVAISIQYGHTASAVDRQNGPRFLRITDIQDGRVDWSVVPSCDIPDDDVPKYQLKPGDLVFARTGATTGKSYLIRDCPQSVFASYLIRVRVSDEVAPEFLALFFQSPGYWAQIESGKRGIGQPNVNGKVLGEVQMPLPPLPEQRRIVAEIETQWAKLDAGVTALKRVQANLKRYRAAVLKAACEGKLVPTEAELRRAEGRGPKIASIPREGATNRAAGARGVQGVVSSGLTGPTTFETGEQLLQRIPTERRESWQGRGKYKEPVTPDISGLPSLPRGWAWASLDQLLILLRNGISAKPDADSGLPILRISAVRPLRVSLEEVRYLAAQSGDYTDFELVADDLLFTRYNGNPEFVGVCGPVPNLTERTVYPDKLIRCRLVDQLVRPRFVAVMANAGWSREYLRKRVRTTAGQAGISGEDVKGTPIPLPPLAEQTRIVAEVERRLSVIDELETLVATNLARASRLRQAVLKQAFPI